MLIKLNLEGKIIYLNTDNISQAYRADQRDGEARMVIYFIHTNPLSILHLRGQDAIEADALFRALTIKEV